MKTLFVVCQHGDEKIPFEVINKSSKGRVDFLVANQEAFNKNIRYVESDLNRSFPGKKNGTKEEKIAYEILKQLKEYDVVLDFHTTSAKSPLFIITTKKSAKHFDFINKLNVERVVFMQKNISSGHSLIDHVELGLSLEVGDGGVNMIKQFLEDYIVGKSGNNKEYFAVFEVLTKESEAEKLAGGISAFRLVRKGQLVSKTGKKKKFAEEDFYPVLPGEKSYKDILCLMARKVDFSKGGEGNE